MNLSESRIYFRAMIFRQETKINFDVKSFGIGFYCAESEIF